MLHHLGPRLPLVPQHARQAGHGPQFLPDPLAVGLQGSLLYHRRFVLPLETPDLVLQPGKGVVKVLEMLRLEELQLRFEELQSFSYGWRRSS